MKHRRKNLSQTIVNIIGIMVVASMILSLALVFIPMPEPEPTPSPTLPPPTTPTATATPVATATPTHSPTVTFTPADIPQPTIAVTATSTMTATVTATPPATATPVAGLATPIPLASGNKDTFTFAGHIHAYAEAPRDGVRYSITGGAGAPLYAREHPQAFYHHVRVMVNGTDVSTEIVEVEM
jgi:FtsP/CotA-like multicopper oxidase with cupredoxin domain